MSFCLLFTGVYLLDKAVLDFTYPWADPIIRHLLISEIGVEPSVVLDSTQVFRNTLGIAGLIAGVTLFARFPRLAAGKRWLGYGFLAFLAGCAIYTVSVGDQSRTEIGSIFTRWGVCGPTIGVCLLAFAVGLIGLQVARRNTDPADDRRQRWVLRGMRPLILCGALAVGLIVASQLYPSKLGQEFTLPDEQRKQLSGAQWDIVKDANFDGKELVQLFKPDGPNDVGKLATRLENLKNVKPLLTAREPVWPVLVAGALFLYLWWLATLLFDMAFVWQRYIRRSVAHDRLREWRAGEPAAAERAA